MYVRAQINVNYDRGNVIVFFNTATDSTMTRFTPTEARLIAARLAAASDLADREMPHFDPTLPIAPTDPPAALNP